MAWAAFQGGDFADAEMLLDESRRRFEKLGDRVGGHWAEGLLAYVTYFQRRFDEAEALASAVIGDAKRWGDAWALLMMQTLLANMRLWTGRIAEAEALAERALAGFRESDDRYGVMSALGPLTRAQVALGKNADAQRGAEESISLGHSFGELGLALQGAAAVAMHLGDAEQALVAVRAGARPPPCDGGLRCRGGRRALAGAEPARAASTRRSRRSRTSTSTTSRSASRRGRWCAPSPATPRAPSPTPRPSRAHPGPATSTSSLARLGGVVAALRTDDPARRRYWFEQLRTIATNAGDTVFLGLTQALAREPATCPSRSARAGAASSSKPCRHDRRHSATLRSRRGPDERARLGGGVGAEPPAEPPLVDPARPVDQQQMLQSPAAGRRPSSSRGIPPVADRIRSASSRRS